MLRHLKQIEQVFLKFKTKGDNIYNVEYPTNEQQISHIKIKENLTPLIQNIRCQSHTKSFLSELR